MSTRLGLLRFTGKHGEAHAVEASEIIRMLWHAPDGPTVVILDNCETLQSMEPLSKLVDDYEALVKRAAR
jgi:hypothetical protein